jgi:hypothetical protein
VCIPVHRTARSGLGRAPVRPSITRIPGGNRHFSGLASRGGGVGVPRAQGGEGRGARDARRGAQEAVKVEHRGPLFSGAPERASGRPKWSPGGRQGRAPRAASLALTVKGRGWSRFRGLKGAPERASGRAKGSPGGRQGRAPRDVFFCQRRAPRAACDRGRGRDSDTPSRSGPRFIRPGPPPSHTAQPAPVFSQDYYETLEGYSRRRRLCTSDHAESGTSGILHRHTFVP